MFTDDMDIGREIKSMYARGNMLIRNLNFLPIDTKCALFKTYCYQMYTSSLWSRYNQSSLRRLRVCYNSIMRRLAGVPPWHSARSMFVRMGVQHFDETYRHACYSMICRLAESPNHIIGTLISCDTHILSSQYERWRNILLTPGSANDGLAGE